MKKIREDHSNSDDHDHHQEEEDVSLCDLPLLSLMKDEENDKKGEYDTKDDVVYTETQEEFAFGTSIGGDGSLSTVSEMCAADEVFFGGQILPLRLSVSSDVGPPRNNDPIRKFGSRSESMDHGSLGGFRSISSRSSSCSSRSTQHSSSCTATITITRVTSEPRLRNLNQFHGHPSPKPQIRISSARLERLGSTSSASRKHKSSMWDFFRLGLVRTPDIELQEVNKVNFIRSNSRPNNNNKGSSSSPPSVSRNSSVNNSENININSSPMSNMNSISTTSNGDNNANGAVLNVEKEKQKRRKFLSGCKCSVDTVASNVIMVKSKGTATTTTTTNTNPNVGSTSGAKHGMTKEKVVLVEELKTTSSKKNNQNQLDKKEQQRQKQEGSRTRKQAMSHHRTYEWLKELSHANLPMHV